MFNRFLVIFLGVLVMTGCNGKANIEYTYPSSPADRKYENVGKLGGGDIYLYKSNKKD